MIVSKNCTSPLPVSWEECRKRGWSELDILLVSGDAYIDHPSFGLAIIGRLLEDHGYRVAILCQPRVDTPVDFKSYPPPQLFCGITAGNLDSIVANYSGNGKVRNVDAYSENGIPWRNGGSMQSKKERKRPDRASIIYSNLARSAFGDTPLVLGGIEASLRRFVHYDFKQEKLRGSILTDAKADLLVYGMGEKQVINIASKCASRKELSFITGTCNRYSEKEFLQHFGSPRIKSSKELLILPSWEEIAKDKSLFLESEIQIDKHLRAYSPRILIQKQQTHWIVQHPPARPLDVIELDSLYSLPFTRRPHPKKQKIPAYETIKDSVTIVRGCSGNCSFCAITRHQGPHITSRSVDSVLQECKKLSETESFSGTISDLGGPTANLYGTSCTIGGCKKHDCLFPQLCPNLRIDEEVFLELLGKVSSIRSIKHLFISSGMRMELLLKTPSLLKRIYEKHTPGLLKIAPEHTDNRILKLMHKEPHELLKKFVAAWRKIGTQKRGKKPELSPYIITAHPGSTVKCADQLAQDMKRLGLRPRSFQDFTPSPGTLSTAMYVTGLHPDTKQEISVCRNQSERKKERQILERILVRKGNTKSQTKSVRSKSKKTIDLLH